MEISGSDEYTLNNDDCSSKDLNTDSENRVTFQPSLIIPPKSNFIPRIRIPTKQANDVNLSNSYRKISSPRISKPLCYDIPLLPMINHKETKNFSPPNSKNFSYSKSRRPLSARSCNNLTLDSLLNSVEKEMVSSKNIQRQKIMNFNNDRIVSSRRSTNLNHLSFTNSKLKIQKPVSQRSYRSETDKLSSTFGYHLNRKYPK